MPRTLHVLAISGSSVFLGTSAHLQGSTGCPENRDDFLLTFLRRFRTTKCDDDV
ncbi:hypothetical protein X777_01989 [Ooceraea biroi]|uniref:Secreted protein n=1 Tax=Ooceraea biroi TaxID=2015173 RepID=A0A026WSA6_OOCBI|nr:hypothetical protein X777_01989 [Ooceraea biroi]